MLLQQQSFSTRSVGLQGQLSRVLQITKTAILFLKPALTIDVTFVGHIAKHPEKSFLKPEDSGSVSSSVCRCAFDMRSECFKHGRVFKAVRVHITRVFSRVISVFTQFVLRPIQEVVHSVIL